MSTESQPNTILDAAVAYARSGLPIFPCKLNKQPYTKDGFKSATTCPEMICSWWHQWPRASIGMPTGKASGRIVIDVDVRSHGGKALDELQAKYGPLPKTLGVKTGGGGTHYYFWARSLGIRNSVSMLGAGLDVRGEGGYVILPPSGHPSGGSYEWLNGSAPVDLPVWLERLVLKRAKNSSPSDVGQKIPTGCRNETLTSLGGTMRRKGMSEEAIRAALSIENITRCQPPLSEADIERIAKSVSRYQEVSAGRWAITETSNAERLVAKYQADLRYSSDRDVWCVWNGAYWVVNDIGAVMRRMQEIARGVYMEAAIEPEENLRKALGAWAKQSDSRRTQENSAAIARYQEGIEVRKFATVFDTHPMLLGVKNGVIDLEKGGLRRHWREDFLTKQVDIEYDPVASCPKFHQFLNETLPAPGLIDYMSRFAGLCLTGVTNEQAWWMFYGPTQTGKSTFLTILRALLGPYALALPENFFLASKSSTDFATANLQGIRLATCVETNEGKLLDVAKVKSLTGQDAISAALKYQNYFEFRPQMKLVLATNHPPRIPQTDASIWRRTKVVPFNITVPEERRIVDLADQLVHDEGPGILRWAVLGCQAWLSNRLVEPECVKSAVSQYQNAENVVRNFVSERLVFDTGARTRRREVYTKYSEWSKESDQRPMSAKRFATELQRLSIFGDPGDRFWLGVRIED